MGSRDKKGSLQQRQRLSHLSSAQSHPYGDAHRDAILPTWFQIQFSGCLASVNHALAAATSAWGSFGLKTGKRLSRAFRTKLIVIKLMHGLHFLLLFVGLLKELRDSSRHLSAAATCAGDEIVCIRDSIGLDKAPWPTLSHHQLTLMTCVSSFASATLLLQVIPMIFESIKGKGNSVLIYFVSIILHVLYQIVLGNPGFQRWSLLHKASLPHQPDWAQCLWHQPGGTDHLGGIFSK